MKKYPFFLIAFVLLLGTSIMISCDKDEDDPEEVKTVLNEETTTEATEAVTAVTEVINMVTTKGDNEQNTAIGKKDDPTCPTVGYTPSGPLTFPKTLTLDFGTGCDIKGRTFKGSISAVVDGGLRTKNTSVTISFTNFSMNEMTLSGSVSYEVDEVNLTTKIIVLATDITDLTVTTPEKSFTFSSTFKLKWLLNVLTDYTDDQFEVTELSMTGTNSKGATFTAELTQTIELSSECREPVSGVIEVTTSDNPYAASVDFGDGTCDGEASVTTKIKIEIGDKVIEEDYTFTLPLP